MYVKYIGRAVEEMESKILADNMEVYHQRSSFVTPPTLTTSPRLYPNAECSVKTTHISHKRKKLLLSYLSKTQIANVFTNITQKKNKKEKTRKYKKNKKYNKTKKKFKSKIKNSRRLPLPMPNKKNN